MDDNCAKYVLSVMVLYLRTHTSDTPLMLEDPSTHISFTEYEMGAPETSFFAAKFGLATSRQRRGRRPGPAENVSHVLALCCPEYRLDRSSERKWREIRADEAL